MTDLPWSAGEWTHLPLSATEQGDDLLVTAAEGRDAWRTTSYGFIHDSEHALLARFHQTAQWRLSSLPPSLLSLIKLGFSSASLRNGGSRPALSLLISGCTSEPSSPMDDRTGRYRQCRLDEKARPRPGELDRRCADSPS